MRKFNLILGVFIVMTLMLTSCDILSQDQTPEGTIIPTPDPDEPLLDDTEEDLEDSTLEPLATPVSLENDDIVEETEIVETSTPDVEATETPIVEVTTTRDETATADQTSTPDRTQIVVPETGITGAEPISYLIGGGVLTMNGEKIGEVSDFLLNIDNRQIVYAVVNVSDFFDDEEKWLAIPYDRLLIADQPEGVIGSQDDGDEMESETQNSSELDEYFNEDLDIVYFVDVTAETLERAPKFNNAAFSSLGEPMPEDWDRKNLNFWEENLPEETEIDETETAETEEVNTEDPETEDASSIVTIVLASALIDWDIVDDSGSLMARVFDAIIDIDNGDILHLVVSDIGVPGFGGRILLMPLNAVSWDYDEDTGSLNVSVDQQVLLGEALFLNDQDIYED